MRLKLRWRDQGITLLTLVVAFLIAFLLRGAIGFSWPWLGLMIAIGVTAIRAAWAISRHGFLEAIYR